MEVAGFTFGAISLGLEVSKILITFVDAVKSRSEHLDALRRQAVTLERNLDFLREVLKRLEQARDEHGTCWWSVEHGSSG